MPDMLPRRRLAPLPNGVAYRTRMESCLLPSTPEYPATESVGMVFAAVETGPHGHLPPGSPAIDAGRPVSLAAPDIGGEARRAAPDIGADEWTDGLPFSFESPWNDSPCHNKKSGTATSRRHVLFASHYTPSPGTKLSFCIRHRIRRGQNLGFHERARPLRLFKAELRATMDSLLPGYHLSVVDLSGFPKVETDRCER